MNIMLNKFTCYSCLQNVIFCLNLFSFFLQISIIYLPMALNFLNFNMIDCFQILLLWVFKIMSSYGDFIFAFFDTEGHMHFLYSARKWILPSNLS